MRSSVAERLSPAPAVVLMASSAFAILAAATASAADSEHSFEVYGFAQADYIQDFDGRVDPAWQDALRPAKIDTDGSFGTDGQSSISVKQSRFGVRGQMPTGGSAPITFRFEFDLFGVGDDAGQTTMRVRHMYGEWGPWLAGQTHTQFMDIDVFPNTIDYWGPPGMAFVRLPQIRWTPIRNDAGHFSIAIERPANDIDGGNVRLAEGWQGSQIQNDETLPDFTAQWRANGDWGHFQAAGILRKVGYEFRQTSGDPWQSGSDTGWGVNVSTAINTVGKDKLLLQALYGEGIATYLNDGGMDLAPETTGTGPTLTATGKAVPLTGIMAYYDHYWNETWSTSIGYSYTEVDNTNFQDPGAFNKGEYASVNLLVTPARNVLVGGELLWGKLTKNDGSSGDVMRFQFSVKYNFSSML
jgi:DcaP outer membrane protein